MEATIIVTVLALLQFIWFSLDVAAMRVKHGVKAPAISGHADFERRFRIQQNTMEQLVVFVPALWMHALVANPWWGAGVGLVYLAGRFIYRAAYFKDPSTRSNGFTIGFVAIAVLLIWALVSAVIRLF